MFEWQRSKSVQFPRQKIYLSSLSQLIQRRLTIQPQAEVNNKLFPQRNFAKKLAITHQRIKSSVQLRTKKFDLHCTSKKMKNMMVENNRSSICEPSKPEDMNIAHKLKSAQLSSIKSDLTATFKPIIQKTYSTVLPERSNTQSPLLMQKSESPQKNFLRKGSNLQNQIVVNLLRSKLLKEQQLNQKKQYSNEQIIKMIQVFKGVALNDIKWKKGTISDSFEKLRQKGTEQLRDIKGWQHEGFHDFQETEQK